MSSNVVFSGYLQFLGITDLLQLIGTNGSTGILRLTNPHIQDKASVTFLRGKPIHAIHGQLKGLECLYSLFGWTTGRFAFSQEKIDSERTIHNGHMEIVLDGLRMLDEGQIQKIGPGWSEKAAGEKGKEHRKVPLLKRPITHYAFMVEEEEFQKGTTIVEEGEFGNWIWMVLNGSAEMSIKTTSGLTSILQVGQGGFVGNLSSMMAMGRRRIATFTATETIRLGVLDIEPLYAEYSGLSDEFRSILLSLDNRFREVTEKISQIHSKKDIKPAKNEKGEYKKTDTPFLIQNGSAQVILHGQNGFLPIINLQTDDFFGPIPFLEMGHEPHSASILFSEDLKATRLDPESLQTEYDQLSGTFKSIIEFTLDCISIATVTVRRNYFENKK